MAFVALPNFAPSYLNGYIPAKRNSKDEVASKLIAAALGSVVGDVTDNLIDTKDEKALRAYQTAQTEALGINNELARAELDMIKSNELNNWLTTNFGENPNVGLASADELAGWREDGKSVSEINDILDARFNTTEATKIVEDENLNPEVPILPDSEVTDEGFKKDVPASKRSMMVDKVLGMEPGSTAETIRDSGSSNAAEFLVKGIPDGIQYGQEMMQPGMEYLYGLSTETAPDYWGEVANRLIPDKELPINVPKPQSELSPRELLQRDGYINRVQLDKNMISTDKTTPLYEEPSIDTLTPAQRAKLLKEFLR